MIIEAVIVAYGYHDKLANKLTRSAAVDVFKAIDVDYDMKGSDYLGPYRVVGTRFEGDARQGKVYVSVEIDEKELDKGWGVSR
jgi:hypothetical protein